MNLPNLPTDNLYKFMALSGIFFAVFGLSVYWIQGGRTQEISQELKGLEIHMDLIMKSYGDSRDSDKEYKDATEQMERAAKLAEELMQLSEERVIYRTFAILSMFFGGILSISGFYLWYFKVQKYHDILLKKESDIGGRRD